MFSDKARTRSAAIARAKSLQAFPCADAVREMAVIPLPKEESICKSSPKSRGLDDLQRQRKRVRGFQSRLVAALMRGEYVEKVEALVGYSMDELRTHLERQFIKGMTWDNHGFMRRGVDRDKRWHIDHIVPKSKFDDIRSAYELSNLRPLWAEDNLAKGQVREHLL